MSRILSLACSALLCWASISTAALAADHQLKSGTPDIKHAGPLTFGPDGILFIGDTLNATIYAIDTSDSKTGEATGEINVEGIDKKIAAMIGSPAEDTLINDIAVNPTSGNVFLSVSRGRGPDSIPLVFKADAKGNVSEVSLENVPFAKAAFENAPEHDKQARRDPRMSAITDLQYNDGKLIVAGLSNEEFASKLRVLNFPFDGQEAGTSVEVYHGAHGKLETASPVRTFITYENTVLAAYTCTPLVTIPVDNLKNEKVQGKTIAELGNRNNPLDMIIYRKGDQDYLLMANSARGVMKIKLSKEEIDSIEPIQSKIDDTAGLPYETLSDLEGVVQLDKLSDDHAVLLVSNATGNMDLRTIALP